MDFLTITLSSYAEEKVLYPSNMEYFKQRLTDNPDEFWRNYFNLIFSGLPRELPQDPIRCWESEFCTYLLI